MPAFRLFVVNLSFIVKGVTMAVNSRPLFSLNSSVGWNHLYWLSLHYLDGVERCTLSQVIRDHPHHQTVGMGSVLANAPTKTSSVQRLTMPGDKG